MSITLASPLTRDSLCLPDLLPLICHSAPVPFSSHFISFALTTPTHSFPPSPCRFDHRHRVFSVCINHLFLPEWICASSTPSPSVPGLSSQDCYQLAQASPSSGLFPWPLSALDRGLIPLAFGLALPSILAFTALLLFSFSLSHTPLSPPLTILPKNPLRLSSSSAKWSDALLNLSSHLVLTSHHRIQDAEQELPQLAAKLHSQELSSVPAIAEGFRLAYALTLDPSPHIASPIL
ncbi:hypothetical protein EDB84DRAFT_556691 [Lactarius hengduanensis]|nr:hypothetical protein EDB84DRAFT_556691 [Lactarius hengduanensis]